MSERYRFEFHGAHFSVEVADDLRDVESTTEAPNLRVLEGGWSTWRFWAEPGTNGLDGLHLARSVDVDGAEHPHGNLTPEQSASVGGQYMGTREGLLYLIPMGYGLVGRLYTSAGWMAQLEEWEQQVRSRGAAA